MRNPVCVLSCVAAVLAFSPDVKAAPMCWGNLAGATYVVSCSNLDQASYQCLATFDVVSGSQKQHYDSSFDVKAAYSGQASAVPSPFSGMNVKGKNFAYSCNMLARKSDGGSGQNQGASGQSSAGSSGASSTNGSSNGSAGSSSQTNGTAASGQ